MSSLNINTLFDEQDKIVINRLKLFDDIFRTDDNFDPYEGISKEELELNNSVSPGLSMTPV